MEKSIPDDEFLGMSYDEMLHWVETNKIFDSHITDIIKGRVERPTLENRIQADYPHYHGIMLPDDPQTSFDVGFDFGVMFTAIQSVLGDKTDKWSDEKRMILRHLVFIGVLNRYEKEKNV